ncbi:hypothetical protein LV475_06865 [Guyparkeria hydrothermalis]|uniref:hypothetical protein n=1 Tax=Guyparkeria hydrothermalis TaxID=923 RepID=UPI002021DAB9|nr:hypothetical protein [Guyparkeria hydrothermalis]MCL7751316.1 hypothetical protein [Guyparkeria hydrothermalis]
MGEAVSPQRFFSRALTLFVAISLLQLFHLLFLARLEWENIVVWLVVFLTGLTALGLIRIKVPSTERWPEFRLRTFLFLFFSSFLVTFVFSRIPYLVAFFDLGMYDLRQESDLGGGGWYSYFAILFYPLAILLAFINISRKWYFVCLFFVAVVVAVDLLVLGTRGAPVFVAIFHLLMARVRYGRLRMWLALLGLVAIFLLVFDYQTKARSLNTVTVGWDWSLTLAHSWLFDRLPLKSWVIDSVSGGLWFLGPVVYFLQYISHSIAEFRFLLFGGTYDLFGSFLYVRDEVCLVLGCGREVIHQAIESANPRAGLYQTLYSSLLIDFGFLGFFGLILAYLVWLVGVSSRVYGMGFLIYFSVVVTVSAVENYFYGGLGLARFIVFGFLWIMLVSPVGIRSRSYLVFSREWAS